MENKLREKIAQGRPVSFSTREVETLRTNIRRAMAVTLEREEEEIGDDALIFDDLGLDSIDVFDLLDQLAETLETEMEIEFIPEEMVHGTEGITFRAFADAIVGYFEKPPSPPETPGEH